MARDRAAYPRKRARQSFPLSELHLFVRTHPRGRDGRGRASHSPPWSVTRRRQTGSLAHVWNEVGVPLARGCVAFAAGDYDRASRTAAANPGRDVPCVGGSDEQRGVFAESHLVSLIRKWPQGQRRAPPSANISRGRPVKPRLSADGPKRFDRRILRLIFTIALQAIQTLDSHLVPLVSDITASKTANMYRIRLKQLK